MSLIPASIRSSLGLHVSSNELSKLEKMDVKNIRNSIIARLDNTLLTTKNTIKQENIIRLKEKISDQKCGGIFDTTHENNIKLQLQTLVDKEVGSDITALTSRPALKLDSLAIWPSASKPGAYGINLPGVGFLKSNSLEEAKTRITDFKHTQFINEAKGIWGNEVAVLNSKPDKSSSQAAIWKSESRLGTFGIHIPNIGSFRVADMNVAQSTFSKYGIAAHIATGEDITVNGANLPSSEVTLAAQFIDKMKKLSSELAFDSNPSLYLAKCKTRDRFANIPTMAHTNIHPELNANRMNIDGKNVAIASQFPKTEQLEQYFNMLVDNRTPVLTVLSTLNEMQTKNLPVYFTGEHHYGNIHTKSVLTDERVELGNNVSAAVYHLTVSGGDKKITIPVIHVENWEDKTALDSSVISELGKLINKKADEKKAAYRNIKSKAVDNPNKMLPVVHCQAGVGRTGVAIAGMVLEQQGNKISLEKIVTDMRNSRNGFMVQTDDQLKVLIKLTEKNELPLFSSI